MLRFVGVRSVSFRWGLAGDGRGRCQGMGNGGGLAVYTCKGGEFLGFIQFRQRRGQITGIHSFRVLLSMRDIAIPQKDSVHFNDPFSHCSNSP